MSFSKLKESLRISSNSLSHHLKILIQNALIKNYYAKKEGSEEYSFYDVTSISKEFMDNVFKTITPIPETPTPYYHKTKISSDAWEIYWSSRIHTLSVISDLLPRSIDGTIVTPLKDLKGLTKEKLDVYKQLLLMFNTVEDANTQVQPMTETSEDTFKPHKASYVISQATTQ